MRVAERERERGGERAKERETETERERERERGGGRGYVQRHENPCTFIEHMWKSGSQRQCDKMVVMV